MKEVALYGIGNFGYALLKHLQKNKNIRLRAFDRKPEVIEQLQKTRTHPYLHKHVEISESVVAVNSEAALVKEAHTLILAVNSEGVRDVLTQLLPHLPEQIHIVNTAKALDNQGRPMSEIVDTVLRGKNYTYSILAGGTIASDLFEQEPLGADIACTDLRIAKQHCTVFQSQSLAVYPTTDVVGVEYASAFKNVISILAGIVTGMGFSYGAQTHVISRAAYEAERLIVNELGGKKKTFRMNSQCWGNDLWMSCTGNTRNRKFGELLGKGLSVDAALDDMAKNHKTVEGIKTIRVLPMFKNLKKYPYLSFVSHFCNAHASLDDLHAILFSKNRG